MKFPLRPYQYSPRAGDELSASTVGAGESGMQVFRGDTHPFDLDTSTPLALNHSLVSVAA
jgi:hypothetical protein